MTHMTDKKANENDKPRIGVFVCHCGINIGSVVDVPKVGCDLQEFQLQVGP